jgi:hypothetical protein
VTLWDAADGRLVRYLPLRGAGRYVRDLGFAAAGRTVWAAQGLGFVQVWDVTTGAERRSAQLGAPNARGIHPDYSRLRVLPGSARAVTLDRVYAGPVATRLAVWDLATGKPRAERSLPFEQREWAWAGPRVALPTPGGLTLTSPETGRVRLTVPAPRPASRSPRPPTAG